jgi:hypothetical protein
MYVVLWLVKIFKLTMSILTEIKFEASSGLIEVGGGATLVVLQAGAPTFLFTFLLLYCYTYVPILQIYVVCISIILLHMHMYVI